MFLSERLSLDPFLADFKPEAPSQTYSINSIVHHIGSTANSGHYTADALRQHEDGKKQWISFDDSVTNETSANTVLKSEQKQKTAYMLLYTAEITSRD